MRGLALVALALGCAAVQRRSSDGAVEGWRRLAGGELVRAAVEFDRAIAARPGDPLAWFGRSTLAYERGASVVALDGYLRILEAGSPDLADAAVARLPTVLDEVPERRNAEARILALPRERLPWRTQVALAEITTSIARRRTDAALLDAQVTRAHCVSAAALVGRAGRLPRLDLDALPPVEGAPALPLSTVGCKLLVPARDGLPGVRVLRADVETGAGEHAFVIAYPGGAALRVDGGPWHRHGSGQSYGPRWSAARRSIAAGRHTVEVRLGTFGGPTELTLLVLEAPPPDREPALDVAEANQLAATLGAALAGEVDRTLAVAGRLGAGRRFAAGLAAAARVAAGDETRPANLGRDQARALYRKALALDERMARVYRELAAIELVDDRPRDAAEHAERALKISPGFWPAALVLADALRGRGLERDADRALDRAMEAADRGVGGCAALDAAVRRARDRNAAVDETRFTKRLAACDGQAEAPLDRLRQHGDLEALEAALVRRQGTTLDPLGLRAELAWVRLASGQAEAAVVDLHALVAAAPRDTHLRLRLADALVAAGHRDRARAVLEQALAMFPTRSDVRGAARAFGLAMPLDPFRLDGREVIRDFVASGRSYDAPAVLLLDRSVARAFADGSQMLLTHQIVRVQSKEGIERWGEVKVPDGAEVLTLRTLKADGTSREPEEIIGKEAISAPDLSAGDYVEWETLETRETSEAFAPGFLGDRFYFQSVEAPLDRSEYLVVTPAGTHLAHDRRVGAPMPVPETGPGGTHLVRFVARQVPQLFPERGAVAALEWIPSVRVSSGVSFERWSSYIADQLYAVARTSPILRDRAKEIARSAGGDLPRALVRWVTARIEPEADLLEPATSVLARGRGNRAGLLLALGRSLGLDARVMLARSLITAAADAPVVAQELDDFSEVVVRLSPSPGVAAVYIDPRLRRAPFGYVPPTVAGAPAFVPGAQRLERIAATSSDARQVLVQARLAADGRGTVSVRETLGGWPALEWIEILDRAGEDRGKLRQEFEQRWLSHQFPGSTLTDLKVEVKGDAGVALTYAFTHPELASREGAILKLVPRFFRAQPGRRYATEPRRRTPLLLGFEVPMDLEARIELPPGARILEAGEGGVVAAGEARFAERREVQPARLVLRRQWRLPLVRVPAAAYEPIAAKLRQIDPIEETEIRIALPSR